MALNRTTWFFKVKNYGWTENFHIPVDDVPTVAARCRDLAPYRKSILANDAELVGVRISDDEIFRDSTFLNDPTIVGPGTFPGTSDPAFTSLLCRFDASTLTRKNLYLRGIPDELVAEGVFVNSVDWLPRFNAWRDRVITFGFGIKRLSLTSNPFYDVQSIGSDGTVLLAQTHTLTAGTKVHFTGVRVTPKLPTVMTVFNPVTSSTFQLAQYAPRPTVLPTGAKVRRYLFQIVPIISGSSERVVKKSTGRPFDTPVGRRRRRA